MDKAELAKLSAGPTDILIDGALAGLKESDRNVRVMALRMLNQAALADKSDEKQIKRIASGILLGLKDEKRRVREIAIKSCGPVMQSSEVSQRLNEIIESPDEKRRNRGGAMMALFSGKSVPVDIVRELVKSPHLRPHLFTFLLGAALSPSAKELLEDFVREGDTAEARAARRALDGEQIVNLAWFREDERRKVKHTHDAWQGVWIWVKRSGKPTPDARPAV